MHNRRFRFVSVCSLSLTAGSLLLACTEVGENRFVVDVPNRADAVREDRAMIAVDVPSATTDSMTEDRPNPADVGDTSYCPSVLGDNGIGLFPSTCPCIPNTVRPCFPGTLAQVDVGACRRGAQRCIGSGEIGRWSETCDGAMAATPERCGNNIDDDCDGTTDNGCGCTLGMSQSCYSGPAMTSGVGRCVAGRQTCEAGRPNAFGACVGEVLPTAESCNNIDDNCNGMVDDGIAQSPCYSGPPATRGVGRCRDGMSACMNGRAGACMGEVLPAVEIAGNRIDDDCDGMTDEVVVGCDTQPIRHVISAMDMCRGAGDCSGRDGECFGPMYFNGGAMGSTTPPGGCGAGVFHCGTLRYGGGMPDHPQYCTVFGVCENGVARTTGYTW